MLFWLRFSKKYYGKKILEKIVDLPQPSDDNDGISPTSNLMDAGMDSFAVTDFSRLLRDAFEIDVTATVVFIYPCNEDFSEHIFDLLGTNAGNQKVVMTETQISQQDSLESKISNNQYGQH